MLVEVDDGTTGMVFWTIYDHPRDHPNHFVVRCWKVQRGEKEPLCYKRCVLATTLEEARATIPEGLHCMGRRPKDDTKIVEVWL
jgi:hypothetical protein